MADAPRTIRIGLDISTEAEIRRAFESNTQGLMRMIKGAFDKTAMKTHKAARDAAPVKTGKLKGEILWYPAKITGHKIEAQVSSQTDYSFYQEYGTGIYGPAGREYTVQHQAKRVFVRRGWWGYWKEQKAWTSKHKGIKGKFFMRKASQVAEKTLTTEIKKAIARWQKRQETGGQ